MKKIISLCLTILIIFSLVGCSTNKQTEYLYTTHGIYFTDGEQNLVITPSGKTYIFVTTEKIKFVDGDKIQLNYEEVDGQIKAKNIVIIEDDFDMTNIINKMKLLKDDFKFGDIYSTLVGIDEEKPKETKLMRIAKIFDTLEGDNIVFSPLSLDYALAIISEGAEDKTVFNEYFGSKDYIDFLSGYEAENLEVANAIYLNNLELNENFEDKLGAEISTEEFNEEFVEKVNAWVNEHTNEMIPSILDEVPEVNAIILNALYFKDSWKNEYSEEQIVEDKFGEEDAIYLNSTESVYYENDKAIGFAKDYNTKFSFIGILPKEEGEFTLESLDLDSLLESETNIETHVKIPEFEFENRVDLTDSIGIDFGEIPNIATEPLKIDQIIQKAKIKVDREGTEASAVTEVTMEVTAAIEEPEYKIVELTRPFAFMIYDKENNTPIFIGKVVKII